MLYNLSGLHNHSVAYNSVDRQPMLDPDRMAICSTTKYFRNLWSVGGQRINGLVSRWCAVGQHPALWSGLFQMTMLIGFAKT